MQDYKLVLRSITGGATVLAPDGSIVVQNASEFMTYLNEQYLSQGYEVKSANLVRVNPSVDGSPVTYEFAYHLVKEINKKKVE